VFLTDGVVGDGHAEVDIDDYGSFGRLVGPNDTDDFDPVGATPFTPTYMAGAYLFVQAPGDVEATMVMLTGHRFWVDLVEPPVNSGDGIIGPRASTLTRTVITPIARVAGSPAEARSVFTISDAPAIQLEIELHQVLIPDSTSKTSELRQTYTIRSTSTGTISLVFLGHWDPDLYYSDNSPFNDIVGAAPGLCYAYVRDPGSTTAALALGDGAASTVPRSYYYAGLDGVVPGAGPAFTVTNSTAQPVRDARGLPLAWRNHAANVGTDIPGDSVTGGDAAMGIEYRFSIAPGTMEVVELERVYGTVARPCRVSASCGDGLLTTGEQCDPGNAVDSATCNGATCTLAACGDGHTNLAAGEECDSIGLDATSCNGGTCLAPRCGDGYLNVATGETCDEGEGDTATCIAMTCQPSSCGDAHVNAVAGEECEVDDPLCDAFTCAYAFTLGGGCVGCGAGDANGALPWSMFVAFCLLRRRRPPRQRTAPE